MIEVVDVSVTYRGADTDSDGVTIDGVAIDGVTIDDVAVDDVSITIDDGESVVLAGANGSGKTSLVRTFNGLTDPTNGEVRIDGTPVGDDLVAARSRVGMVFQDPRDQIVAATVGADVAFGPENLGLPCPEIDRRVEEALSAVDLGGRREDRVETLSGGERERLAIAGALAMEPGHLVLDEPFTGLDDPSRRGVLDRLADLRALGTSLILVTHDLRDVLTLADRVIVLADGAVAVDAPPEDALKRIEDRGGLGVRVPQGVKPLDQDTGA